MVAGGLAGTLGGRADTALMLLADFLLALPGAYLILVLRGLLPPVLSTQEIFTITAALFAFAAWPHASRGVRAIVAAERTREYAEAARACGAGSWRLMRHLLPAARGFLAVELVLLVPALLVAEATVSYLGLGFADAEASWGTMLQDAANVHVLVEAPWLLAPAVGLFLVVLGAQLLCRHVSLPHASLVVASGHARTAVRDLSAASHNL
jgi:peptide/nickel transport system permease protein